jgi:2-polyprenyl-3-methyl-5-hydroxy-6-metoxy-1,4-benzoquinol methylase
MRTLLKKVFFYFTHIIGKINGKYYFEDYKRVYPDGLAFNRLGKKSKWTKDELNNYLNHSKFYRFAAQFVNNKEVFDIGCGSGYGSKIIKESGSVSVNGYDISKSSIRYAKSHFSNYGTFNVCSIVDMSQIADNSSDITINSEVLEHIKEYNMEQKAIDELKRITKNKGLIIIGTPNTELSNDHGFSYDDINALFSRNFSHYCIFENAFIPFGEYKKLWVKRLEEKNTGVIISELINIEESCIPDGFIPELKHGLEAGTYNFENYKIDTKLLHNTHSWIIVAINEK